MSETPAAPAAADSASTSNSAFEILEQKVSYGIGRNIGADLTRNLGDDTDAEALVAGHLDSLSGAAPQVPQAELSAAFHTFQAKTQAAAESAVAKKAGTEFLTANGARPEVTTTESGLLYEILTPGTGPKPASNNTVKVHYHGTLIDGTVFDSSVERGEPVEFPVTGVMPGWIEALQLMPTGSKWKLFIPSNLAYGDRATGKIPAGSTLVFEVELLEVK
ncbi:MAG: FKBP-type peptidyl-prolyl cis-trans isomerase [Candidatus Synoicihabitans palmerolidicus]|nr:FKBP-type peptidyl-prolyl cis-trans isomerase [Candidatus Synoicihabitans palmerolidicus]